MSRAWNHSRSWWGQRLAPSRGLACSGAGGLLRWGREATAGCSSAWLERAVWGREAGGSNPPTPTTLLVAPPASPPSPPRTPPAISAAGRTYQNRNPASGAAIETVPDSDASDIDHAVQAGRAALDVYTEWKTVFVDSSGRLQRAQIDSFRRTRRPSRPGPSRVSRGGSARPRRASPRTSPDRRTGPASPPYRRGWGRWRCRSRG